MSTLVGQAGSDPRELSLPERFDGDEFERLFEEERDFVAGADEELKALAISGGGVRSASFALGILQALVAGRKLEEFHYLSTVSGGGYIGSSLTWFLKQGLPSPSGESLPAGTRPEDFPFGARTSGKNAAAQNAVLSYLRKHASYLNPTPRLNVISLAAVVLRSSFVSLTVHFSLLTATMGLLLWRGLFDPIPLGALGKFDWLVPYAPNPLLLAAAVIVGLLGWSSLVYAPFARFLTGEHGYASRTRVQRTIGRVSAVAISLAVVGALPLVHVLLEKLLSQDKIIASALCGTGSTVLGALLGMYEGGSQMRQGGASSIVAKVRPYLAVILLLCGLLIAALAFADFLRSHDLQAVTWGVGAFGFLLGWVSNTNYLGLHRMYRDRLMELFLPSPEAVVRQHWKLARAADTTRFDRMCGVPDGKCKRPYHLVNANVVLVDSPTSDFRARGGDSFLLSPLYTGSRATGWVRSDKYMVRRGRGLTLATAMAISGAAVNPNTGVAGRGLMRNRLVSMLLTALNLRLGYWAPNPKRQKERNPNFISPGLVAGVLAGGLHEDAPMVELTDGGHFENLGLYELLRRRVRFIVVSDAGCDPSFDFADLANAVERARVDFGAKIDFRGDFPLADLLPGSGPKQPTSLDARYQLAKRGFAEGSIRYPGDPPNAPSGRIVYFKATLIPDLPADVLGYKAAHADFPHESTADQFFHEAQFEAYRELGYHIGWQWLESLAERDEASVSETGKRRVADPLREAS